MNKQFLLSSWKNLIKDKAVLDAFRKVARESFVLEEYKESAYEDRALPIICNQTISQPTTVMIMLQELELKKGDKVLEIGTGSGYNAALIAEIIKPGIVYTTEIIPELVKYAKQRLKDYKNIKIIKTDGSKGLQKYAPFDKIIITAACPKLPHQLIAQLKNNGILIAPIGPLYPQKLTKIIKQNNKLKIRELGPFVFVPLTGKFGWKPND